MDLARELEDRIARLARGEIDLASLLSWAGEVDLSHGAKPAGDILFPDRRPPERLDRFRPLSRDECRLLAAGVLERTLSCEDAVFLVALRHSRGGSDRPLADWLVRFGALRPSDRDALVARAAGDAPLVSEPGRTGSGRGVLGLLRSILGLGRGR